MACNDLITKNLSSKKRPALALEHGIDAKTPSTIIVEAGGGKNRPLNQQD